MKILSFNYKGLEIPHKKFSLKRLVSLHQPDVVLFQETLADEVSATKTLSTLFPWDGFSWDWMLEEGRVA
jgi:exonuclease III